MGAGKFRVPFSREAYPKSQCTVPLQLTSGPEDDILCSPIDRIRRLLYPSDKQMYTWDRNVATGDRCPELLSSSHVNQCGRNEVTDS